MGDRLPPSIGYHNHGTGPTRRFDRSVIEVAFNEPDAKAHSVDHAEYVFHSSQAVIEAALAASDEDSKISEGTLLTILASCHYSALPSLVLIMEGMDVGLINNFFAHVAYLKKFGWPDANGKQQIPAIWIFLSARDAGPNFRRA
ncbi:hypothetical protein SCUP234_13167 [Seiridium cupressi]